jgi:hypothetical protein
MRSRDGRWRVEVGGLGADVVWYRLIGPGADRWLPSMAALERALAEAGVELGELREAAGCSSS